MLYLTLVKGKKRLSGEHATVPVIVDKAHRFAKHQSKQNLRVKTCYLIEGEAQSGKSKWLTRLYSSAQSIWRDEKPCFFLGARQPLSQWLTNDLLKSYAYAQERDYSKLQQWERLQVMRDYFVTEKPVLLLDNADLLAGQKLELAADLLRSCGVFVATCKTETRIQVSVRMAIQSRKPEIVTLKSQAPADMTEVLMWIFTLISLGVGAYGLAAALGGLSMMAKGKRASKQG